MDPIIILLRIILPLLILRFPLAGGLIAVWLDGIDWHVNFFNSENIHLYYQELDKILDIYYLTLEAVVAYRWKNQFAGRIAISLFVYRLVGIFFYELTHLRILLFLFPNIFESFFLFYLGCKKLLHKDIRLSWLPAVIGVSILTIFKLIQEYPMHVQELWQWRYVEVSLFSHDIVFQYDNIFHQALIIVCLVLLFVYFTNKHPRLHSLRLRIKKFYSAKPD